MRMLVPGYAIETQQAGLAVLVADADINENGGIIVNPLSASDQKVPVAESIFVNLLGPATLLAAPGNTELVPGQTFLVPPRSSIWVNTPTNHHKFTAFFSTTYKVTYPPRPVPGQPGTDVPGIAAEPGTQPFPPGHVTGLTTVIPSYLYQQYTDDDDLQGFVEAQNIMQQDYVDTFNALNLPIYPGPIVSGLLLDWVGRGLYGMARPVLGSGRPNLMGPLNTFGCNWLVPMWDYPNLTFSRGDWLVATNVPNLNPVNVNPKTGDYWTAVTADPSIPESAPSFLPGIGGSLISDGDKILWDSTRNIYLQTVSAAVEARFGLNMAVLYGNMNVYLTNDDTYRRILTWHFFKQDGNYFSTRWLKRRIWRFLWCTDGISADFSVDPVTGKQRRAPTWPGGIAEPGDAFVADTKQISVSLGVNRNVTIRFVLGNRPVTGGAMCNRFGCNGYQPAFGIPVRPPPADDGGGVWDIGTDVTPMPTGIRPPAGIYINDIETSYEKYPPLPFMYIFKQALDLGVIETPYQFNYTCTIG